MTIHYEITKALKRKDFEAVHPCMGYMECRMVRLTDRKEYVRYYNPFIEIYWSKLSHGVCPQCKESMLEEMAKKED